MQKPKLFCESLIEERSAGNPHATFCEGEGLPVSGSLLYSMCALQVQGDLSPEMAIMVKPSQQPCTESCVVAGNGQHEA
jgi:hypothetical protein